MSESNSSNDADIASSTLDQPTADSLSLGKVLREAREARGLSVADVTQAVKFSPKQIDALEHDEFDKLPGNNFIRGMVRTYAKLLQIDEAPLTAMLNERLSVPANQLQPPEDLGTELPLPSTWRSAVPIVAVVVGLAIIALGVAGYFGWPGGPASHRQGADNAVLNPPIVPPAVPSAVPSAAPPAAPIAPSGPAASAATSAAASLPAAVSGVASQPEAAKLAFNFKGASWVEVKDATSHIVFAQNNAAGTHQVVSGKPPFDLVIGNASQVDLQYGEKAIDLRPYTKVDVARFRLE